MNWNAFFSKFGISEDDFEASQCDQGCLEAIRADYDSLKQTYQDTADSVATCLQRIKEVHSVRARRKDPEHLIEKIIRKQKESRERPTTGAETKVEPRNITLENYRQEITDLAGVRALHLFKADWLPIHKAVLNEWDLKHGEPKLAYVRVGDSPEFCKQFEENDCIVKPHPKHYRSVHYIVDPKKKSGPFFIEIQVRTLFEEGWSEIDHRLRYDRGVGNMILGHHLDVFNRVAGIADEMGAIAETLNLFSMSDSDFVSRAIDLKEAGDTEKALRALERVKAEHPEDHRVWLMLATVQYAAGKWQEAADSYGRYLRLHRDDSEARLDCSMALAHLFNEGSCDKQEVLDAICEQLRKVLGDEDVCKRAP